MVHLTLEKISAVLSQQKSSVQRFPTRGIHNGFCLFRDWFYLCLSLLLAAQQLMFWSEVIIRWILNVSSPRDSDKTIHVHSYVLSKADTKESKNSHIPLFIAVH